MSDAIDKAIQDGIARLRQHVASCIRDGHPATIVESTAARHERGERGETASGETASGYLEKAIQDTTAAFKQQIEDSIMRSARPTVVESTAIVLADVPALEAPQESAS